MCIPAFNRSNKLKILLDSIFDQKYKDIEVVICEDKSPERNAIKQVILEYPEEYRKKIQYFENKSNLGYDKNLRNVISKASGEYIILMGNDDFMETNSLRVISDKIHKYQPGAIIRSYKSFYKEVENSFQIHRYVSKDKLVAYSPEETAWAFYRSVLVSGLVIKTDLAHRFSTDAVDGTLYYQNYIIGRILKESNIVYVPDILVHNRLLDFADFGSSENERKGKWIPGQRTIDSSVYQMGQFFHCAAILEKDLNAPIVQALKRIASAYSFSVLSYHVDKGTGPFLNYMKDLNKIGYRGIFFYLYGMILLILGRQKSEKLVAVFKAILGHTARIA